MKFSPNVFIVKKEYHIVVVTKKCSQVFIRIGRKIYGETNCGIIPKLDNVHKIVIHQKTLDRAGRYEIIVKPVKKTDVYYSALYDPIVYSFDFKNDRFDGLRGYYLADIHRLYDQAEKLVRFYRDLDFVIINGDYGELETQKDILRFNRFIAKITKGKIPVLYARGNHDTRGVCAELLPKYMGMDGQNGYFTFTFRSINGVALDCGEDKWDKEIVYGGLNDFERYRRREARWLKKVKLVGQYTLAVSHISFMLARSMHGQFDIDRETYGKIAKEMNRIQPQLMICGHTHNFSIDLPNETDLQPHNYPVLTGSRVDHYKYLFGTALEFKDGKIYCKFTDVNKNVLDEYEF